MHCIDFCHRVGVAAAMGLTLVLAGCASAPPSSGDEPGPSSNPAAGHVSDPASGHASGHTCDPPRATEPVAHLGLPATLKSMLEVRVQAALRMVDANPDGTYEDRPPDVLLAIPVLEIELDANGSVCHIHVARHPGQAPETTQIAIDAVHRAAPFGNVSHLPKPWVFTEVFLFRDDRRFKPRTLDD